MPVQAFSHDRWHAIDVADRRTSLVYRHRLGNLSAGILAALAGVVGVAMAVPGSPLAAMGGPPTWSACAGMLVAGVAGVAMAIWAARKARAIETLDASCRELDLNEIACLTNLASSHKDIARALLSWLDENFPVQYRDFLAAKTHAARVDAEAKANQMATRQRELRAHAMAEMERVARVSAPQSAPQSKPASQGAVEEFPDTAASAKRRIEAAAMDYARLIIKERLTGRAEPGRARVLRDLHSVATANDQARRAASA